MHAKWLSLVLVALTACMGGPSERSREGLGGRRYGGVFNANETERIRSLFPLSLTQAVAFRVASPIYEGLVRFDPKDLSVQPCLAERWEVSEDGLVYTFFLRKGVRFHDAPCFEDGKGREVTAEDVRYCFAELCTARPDNQLFWLFQDHVEGANAHYQSTLQGKPDRAGPSGIKALGPYELEIRLVHPVPTFLQVMAHPGCWIFPKELDDKYPGEQQDRAVGTGPFAQHLYRPGDVIVLERSPHYWGRDEHGNELPFLDAVRYTFSGDKQRELAEFRKGNLAVVFEIPGGMEELSDSVDLGSGTARFRVNAASALSTQFYGFNALRPPFSDKRVRTAFTLAVDRSFLVDSVLNGLGVPAEGAFVAPGLNGYPYDEVQGLPYDPDRARALLEEAGFPGGSDFPNLTLQLSNNNVAHVRVAAAVQEMLMRELNVRISTSMLPADQHFDRVERNKAEFWREGWLADFPDPENFLALFLGRNAAADTSEPSYLNTTRYRDPVYDSLFVAATMARDEQERMRLLAEADQHMLDDAVVLPLYHDRTVRLIQPWVRDLPLNAMEYRDLARVWFER